MFPKSTLVTLSLLFGQSMAGLLFAEVASQLPRDVAHIGVDETLGHYVAYKEDGTVYGRYVADLSRDWGLQKRKADASGCTNLTVDQAKSLPGWNTLNAYADKTWGKGSRKIVTNPSDEPNSPALVCVTDEIVKLKYKGAPTCQTHNVSTAGQLAGTNGTVALEVDQGFTSDSTFSVSKAASIGISSTTTVKLGFPEIADVDEAITVSTEVTNTQTKSFSATYSDLSKVTLTYQAVAGKKCNAINSVKTCTLQGTGKIRYLASGWVWFNYNDKTKGHYKWAASLETVLKNIDDRSQFMEFQGSVTANTHANYKGTCK